MSGAHSVIVYPDRFAGEWSDVVASNPFFTTSLDGWYQEPFSEPLQWRPGSITTGKSGLIRNAAYPILRPASAITWRLRIQFSVRDVNLDGCAVFWGINLGKTPTDASLGDFWVGPENATSQLWGATLVPDDGTYTASGTWQVTSDDWPEFPYIAPRIGGIAIDGAPAEDSTASMTVHAVLLDYRTAEGVEITCLVDQVQIHHGRDDVDSQPEPASATLEISRDELDEFPLPEMVEIGAVVEVVTRTQAVSSTRFLGRITDITLGWEDAGEDTPEAATGQIVCTALLADLGRRVVGDEPWPTERDGRRVGRIFELAGYGLDPEFSDPGTVNILARDVDAQAALELAQAVAADASGMVWHTRDGQILYADADHRRGATPMLALDACDIEVTPTWSRTVAGLVNEVSIGYGVAAEGGDDEEGGGEQPRVSASDVASIARYGRYYYTAGTQLAEEADALELARMLMVRNSQPVWIMTSLPVDVESLDGNEYAALLTLDVHELVSLTGLPAIGSAPTSAVLWVEGWAETLTYGMHEIELVVSGYCRTSPPPRWADLDPSWTWATVDPSLTWRDTTCLGPQPPHGRWSDVPASLRWRRVDPSLSWATWESNEITRRKEAA